MNQENKLLLRVFFFFFGKPLPLSSVRKKLKEELKDSVPQLGSRRAVSWGHACLSEWMEEEYNEEPC